MPAAAVAATSATAMSAVSAAAAGSATPAPHATSAQSGGEDASLPRLRGSVMVTSDTRQLASAAMEGVTTLVAAGPSAPEALRAFCEARGVPVPALTLPEAHADASDVDRDLNLDRDHAILWQLASGVAPRIFRIGRCRESRR
jgi:hypothetical protein